MGTANQNVVIKCEGGYLACLDRAEAPATRATEFTKTPDLELDIVAYPSLKEFHLFEGAITCTFDFKGAVKEVETIDEGTLTSIGQVPAMIKGTTLCGMDRKLLEEIPGCKVTEVTGTGARVIVSDTTAVPTRKCWVFISEQPNGEAFEFAIYNGQLSANIEYAVGDGQFAKMEFEIKGTRDKTRAKDDRVARVTLNL